MANQALAQQIKAKLDSGVDNGGQPLTSVQKASLQSQYDSVSGNITQAQAVAKRDQATADALKSSKTINNYTFTDPVNTAAQQAINTKYKLDPMTGLTGKKIQAPNIPAPIPTEIPAAQQSVRDHEKEAAMIKQLGGPPTTPQETADFVKATYPPNVWQNDPELSAMVANASKGMGAAMSGGSKPVFDPAVLKAQGFNDEQIKAMGQQGADANAAQGQLNSLSKPTNFNLRVLEEALNAKNNVTNQPLGESKLFQAAGVGGFGALQASLGQRAEEMNTKYNSFTHAMSGAADFQLETFKAANDAYKATMDQYNKDVERITRLNEKAQDWEHALTQMQKQQDFEKERMAYADQLETKKYNDRNMYDPITLANGSTAIYDKKTGQIVRQIDGFGNVVAGEGTKVETSLGSSINPNVPAGYVQIGNKAISNDVLKKVFNVGKYGGQCGTWASTMSTASKVGNTWREKRAHIDTTGDDVINGNASLGAGFKLVTPLAVKTDNSPGHVQLVLSYNPQTGDIQTVEANRDLKGTVALKKENIHDLKKRFGNNWGFVSGKLKSPIAQALSSQGEDMKAITGAYQASNANVIANVYNKPEFAKIAVALNKSSSAVAKHFNDLGLQLDPMANQEWQDQPEEQEPQDFATLVKSDLKAAQQMAYKEAVSQGVTGAKAFEVAQSWVNAGILPKGGEEDNGGVVDDAVNGIISYSQLLQGQSKEDIPKLKAQFSTQIKKLAEQESDPLIKKMILSRAKGDPDQSTDQQWNKAYQGFNQLLDMKDTLDRLTKSGKTGVLKGRLADLDINDPDVSLLKGQVAGLIPTVARGTFGEVGVLTDADINNYQKVVGDKNSSPQQIKAATDNLSKTIFRNYISSLESSPKNTSNRIEQYKSIKDRLPADVKKELGIKDSANNNNSGGTVLVKGPDGKIYSMTQADAQQASKEGGQILN